MVAATLTTAPVAYFQWRDHDPLLEQSLHLSVTVRFSRPGYHIPYILLMQYEGETVMFSLDLDLFCSRMYIFIMSLVTLIDLDGSFRSGTCDSLLHTDGGVAKAYRTSLSVS